MTGVLVRTRHLKTTHTVPVQAELGRAAEVAKGCRTAEARGPRQGPPDTCHRECGSDLGSGLHAESPLLLFRAPQRARLFLQPQTGLEVSLKHVVSVYWAPFGSGCQLVGGGWDSLPSLSTPRVAQPPSLSTRPPALPVPGRGRQQLCRVGQRWPQVWGCPAGGQIPGSLRGGPADAEVIRTQGLLPPGTGRLRALHTWNFT